MGTFAATDFLDDDGLSESPIPIRVSVQIDPSARSAKVDFSGSGAQVNSSINAVYAITYSAVYYVFRCLLSDEAPASSGIMRPIEVIAPIGTIVNARPRQPWPEEMWKLRNASLTYCFVLLQSHP